MHNRGMANQAPNRSLPGARRFPWSGSAGVALVLAGCGLSRAQEHIPPPANPASSGQIAPSPAAEVPATLSEQANPGEFQVIQGSKAPRGALDEPFQYDRVIFRPNVSYRFLYGNGMQSAPGMRNNTIIQDLSPGLLVDLGPDWVLSYTPTLRYYSGNAFQDGLDQSVVLRGGVAYEKWRLGLAQSFSESSSPTVETGGQVDQRAYGTMLSANYAINAILSLDLGANQSLNFASGAANGAALQSTEQWSSLDFLNFKFWQRFTFGVGAGGGYVGSDNSPNQTFEQFKGRFGWKLTDRVSLQADAGVDDRRFSGAGRSSAVNPVWDGTLQYQPFDHTSLYVKISQAITQSVLQNQVTVNTSYGAGVTQRLLGHFNLNLSGNYGTEDFLATQTVLTSRTDDNYSFNARLSWPFLRRGSIGLTYQYSYNKSSEAGMTYGTTQMGFDVGYSY